MLRFLRFLIGATLVPLCIAVTMALLDLLRLIPAKSHSLISPESTWLLTGYFLWLGMWFFLPRPVRAYVVAHELTHALWGLLFGARVSGLRVSDKGGSVRLSKSNMLITLAPYFFPFYTILVILLRAAIVFFVPQVPYPLLWLFLVGLTWGFHVTFTVQSLMISQPDVLEYGRLFSYTIIYLFNLTGVGIWIVCTTSLAFGDFFSAVLLHTFSVYASITDEVRARLHFLQTTVKPSVLKLLYYRGT